MKKTFKVSKLIAEAGICSRRKAEILIKEGRVKLNNKILKSVPERATTKDIISVDNKEINIKKKIRLWKYYKSTGLLTTNYDPLGRKTIFEVIPKTLPRIVTVGRLDLNSEGLLLLTNSGSFSRHLELPKNSFIREYKVKVRGKIDIEKLASLWMAYRREPTLDKVQKSNIFGYAGDKYYDELFNKNPDLYKVNWFRNEEWKKVQQSKEI